MALPKLETPIYELELPSTGEKVKYRPFLVKEQKNLMIALNVINFSYKNKIKNLIFFASNCIYPKFSSQPIKEKYLLTGELDESISYYAIAKISGLKLCQAYNRQYNTKYRTLIPPNLFGINDNFNLSTAHVLPALLFKFHNAKKKSLKRKSKEISNFGSKLLLKSHNFGMIF